MITSFLILLLSSTLLTGGSIYDIKIKSLDGQTIDFSDFKGKKILITNIATESKYESQLSALEQLQQKYKSTLVVVGVPSNSFGKESKDEKTLKARLKDQYKVSFLVAQKMKVKEADRSPLYQWLSAGNDKIKKEVTGDFHKYLINTEGELMAYFTGLVSPTDSILTNLIEEKR